MYARERDREDETESSGHSRDDGKDLMVGVSACIGISGIWIFN